MLPKANEQKKKKDDLPDLSPKKSKSFDENWRNGGCFLDSTNIMPHALFTLEPPTGY